jgi:hypothetical protein
MLQHERLRQHCNQGITTAVSKETVVSKVTVQQLNEKRIGQESAREVLFPMQKHKDRLKMSTGILVVELCSLVKVHRRFRGTCIRHHGDVWHVTST